VASAAAGRIDLRYVKAEPAEWTLAIAPGIAQSELADLRRRIEKTAHQAQYGWGHTIDFGPFRIEGILGTKYLGMVGAVDHLGWWPRDLHGVRLADIGAYSGGVTALLASRGAETVFAIDEVLEHVEQAGVVVDAFGLTQAQVMHASLYDLSPGAVGSLDYVFLGGVLYHLSDMLVGLILLRRLLDARGWLILDTNAVECATHSYANFGRFYAGMWWQPSALCVLDMLRFAGYVDAEVAFYSPGRALARARRGDAPGPPFARGLSISVDSLRDPVGRPMDAAVMAPAPDAHAYVGLMRRVALRAIELGLRAPLLVARRIRRR
jgi:SAM-dependent methyltransferase